MKSQTVQTNPHETTTNDVDDHSQEVAQAIAIADVLLERIAVMRGGPETSHTHNNINRSPSPAETGQEYSRRAGGGYQSQGITTGTANSTPATSTQQNPPSNMIDATRLADAILNAALQRGGFPLSPGYGLGPLTQPPSAGLPVPGWIGHLSPYANHSGERTAPLEKPHQVHERPGEPRSREVIGREPVQLRPEAGEVRREDIARAISQLLTGVVDERAVKQPSAQAADKGDLTRSPAEPGPTSAEQRPSDPRREVAAQERAPVTPVDVQAILNDPRNDAARIIQQLLANDAAHKIPQGTTHDVTGRSQQAPNSQEQLPSASTIQGSIRAHTDHLRDILQTVLERTTPRPSNDPDFRPQSQASAVGTTGDYTRIEPPVRNVPPSTDVQWEGRNAPTQPNAGTEPSMTRIEHGTSGRGDQLARPVGPDGPPRVDSLTTPLNHAEQGRSLLRAIHSAADKILTIEVLRKLDRALETAIISAAAGVTLGIMGAEVVAREIFKVALGLLELLKSEKETNPTVESVITDLEEMCHDRGVEKIEKPAERVADITGVIVLSGSGLPVEGIIVDGGSLGLAITDITGHFHLRNVPLDTGFELLVKDKNYTFFPEAIVGTVSGSDYYTVTATKN